ncbi:MAG: thiamine diphosphokinase [Clostridia bacterium]|nr:thiamine diphosphokinase [Clostridia bacterium]
MNTCYIVCALDCKPAFVPDKTDLVIGADRGYFTLVKNGLVPDAVIGDFDSYTGEVECENVVRYPVKKDDTDSALAIKYAVEKGYKTIVIYGAIGGMLDHTIANISLLGCYTKEGINVSFVDGNNVLFAMQNKTISFSKEAEGRISIFSFLENAHNVCINGLMYEVDNYTLTNDRALGVSNEFIGKKSIISVENGVLLIYTTKKNYDLHLTFE